MVKATRIKTVAIILARGYSRRRLHLWMSVPQSTSTEKCGKPTKAATEEVPKSRYLLTLSQVPTYLVSVRRSVLANPANPAARVIIAGATSALALLSLPSKN